MSEFQLGEGGLEVFDNGVRGSGRHGRSRSPRRLSEWEFVNGAGGKQCDIDVPKHRRSPRTGEVESINFGGDDVGIWRWLRASSGCQLYGGRRRNCECV